MQALNMIATRATTTAFRVVSISWGCMMMLAAGTQYMFSAYSSEFRSATGASQAVVSTFGTAIQVGIYVGGLVPGYMFDKLRIRALATDDNNLGAIRKPTIVTSVGGAVLLCSGYAGASALAFGAAANFSRVSLALVGCLAFALIGLGSASSYTAALATNVHNICPQNLGVVVGVLVSFFGVSAAIFTAIYSAFFEHVGGLLAFLSVCAGSISVLGAGFVCEVRNRQNSACAASDERTKLLAGPNSDSFVEMSDDLSLRQLLKRWQFWILFLLFGSCAGAGFVIFNQLGEIWLSLGGKHGQQRPLVVWLSVLNCIGRVGFGFGSDFLGRVRGVNRTWFVCGACAMMTIAHLYLLNADQASQILPAVLLAGAAYGGLMASTPAVIGEAFGRTYFGTNWAAVRAAPALGSALLATVIASVVYRSHASINGEGDESCLGQECFRTTFGVCAGVSAISTVCAGILALSLAALSRERKNQAVETVRR